MTRVLSSSLLVRVLVLSLVFILVHVLVRVRVLVLVRLLYAYFTTHLDVTQRTHSISS